MKPRRCVGVSLATARLRAILVPLLGDAAFSLKSNQTGKCCTAANYSWAIHNCSWYIAIAFLLALEAIVISLAIFVPTIYWEDSRGCGP